MTEDELGVLGRVWDGMGWDDDIRSGFYVPQPMPKTFIHVFFMLQAKRMLQLAPAACLPASASRINGSPARQTPALISINANSAM